MVSDGSDDETVYRLWKLLLSLLIVLANENRIVLYWYDGSAFVMKSSA